MITLRTPTSAYLAVITAVLLPGVALLELAAALHSPPFGATAFALIALGLPVTVGNLATRVRLSPAGVQIRSLLRSRRIGWRDVRSVTVLQTRAGRRVTLWTHTGQRVILPLPMTRKTWNEDGFLTDYHRIGQYWQAMQAPAGA